MINRTLGTVRELYASKSYDAALAELDGYEKKCELTAEMLLLKGRLIQLSESGERPLSDAKECLLNALIQDKENIKVLLELGWLYASVLGDPDEGKRYFSKALEQCSALSDEAMRGLKTAQE